MRLKNALAAAVFAVVTSVLGTNFQQTPYVQYPATNAMRLIWFTDSACEATVTWRSEAGGRRAAVGLSGAVRMVEMTGYWEVLQS